MKKIVIFFTAIFLFGFFDEKLYNLMYVSFVTNKNYKSAYEVAKKALEYRKNSLMWRKRVANVSLLLGNYRVAYQNYMRIYKITKSRKIEKVLLTFSLKDRELIKLKERVYFREIKRGNFKNIETLAYLYYLDGKVKKAENVAKLAYLKDRKYLKLYVKYAILTNDLQVVKRHLSFLVKSNLKSRIELAHMLADNRDFRDAYNLLIYTKELPQNLDYYKLLLYVTYQVKEFKNLEKLLNYMYLNNLMDKSSFSLMLSYYYSKQDNKKLEKILKEAIEKFKFNVYKDYLNVLVANENYRTALEELDKYKRYLSEKDYLKLKAFIFYKLKDYRRAGEFYEKLLVYDLKKDEVNEIVWFCVDSENYHLFEKIKERVDNHYLLATAYLTFFKVDMAYREMKKVKLDSLDKYFTLIEILDIKGRDSFKYKLKAFKFAKRVLEQNKRVLYNENFLKNYIRLSFYFAPYKRVEELFEFAKGVLSKQDYFDLKIAYYFKLKVYDKLYYIKNYNRIFE